MAGDVTVAVVSAALSTTDGGTTDFTKADFGTPKACMVLVSFDAVDDANVADEEKASTGFSDFTNHRSISHQSEHASAKSDTNKLKSATKAYVVLDVAGAVDFSGTASTITDGVRLTHTTGESPASAVFATVVMFGGADLQVSVDSIALTNTLNSTTLTTTSIDQDIVFFIGLDDNAEDNASNNVVSGFGAAHIDTSDHTTFVNRSMSWSEKHNANSARVYALVANDRCLGLVEDDGSVLWGIELTAATTTSYTITVRDVVPGNDMEVYALALDLDDRGSKIGSVDSPTSGATWTPSVTLGFTPQYVGLALTHAQAEGTVEGDADARGLGISSNTGSGEETCHSWYSEDAAATMNTANLFRSRAIDFRDDVQTTVIQDHSHSSFDSGGWTYTINTENETTARKWFYWAIEEAAVAGAANPLAGSLASTGVGW